MLFTTAVSIIITGRYLAIRLQLMVIYNRLFIAYCMFIYNGDSTRLRVVLSIALVSNITYHGIGYFLRRQHRHFTDHHDLNIICYLRL